jgi:uncharacterized peroxidase-related enzyme
MAFIRTIAEEAAEGDLAALYEADRESLGYVANYTKTFSHRPAAIRGWQQLNVAIKSGMDLRRYELATLAAARRLRSSYCALAHGKVIVDKFLSPEQTRDVALDHHHAGLDEIDVAIMDLAEKVAGDAASIVDADLDPLRQLGLPDDEIFDVILAASARCFFSTVLDATGTEPDPAYNAIDEDLRHALVVGRPIADS